MSELPPCPCPECGCVLDAATGVAATGLKGEVRPEPGDLSVCIRCLSFLRFDEDLRLVAIPDAEFRALPPVVRSRLHHIRRVAGPVDRR